MKFRSQKKVKKTPAKIDSEMSSWPFKICVFFCSLAFKKNLPNIFKVINFGTNQMRIDMDDTSAHKRENSLTARRVNAILQVTVREGRNFRFETA